MGRCPNCPLWVAIEAANEISDEFDKDAVDNAMKPGAMMQKRHKMQRRAFQSIEHRINCHYTKDDEPATEAEQTDTVAPAEHEPVNLDQPETDEEQPEKVRVQVSPDQLLALLGGQVAVKACMEPYQLELQMLTVGNGDTLWPDGHYDSPENRKKAPQQSTDDSRGRGQYL